MRISSVIQLARQYMLVGIMGAVIAIGLFLIGYFIVYKKLMKGTNLHLFSSYKEAYDKILSGEFRLNDVIQKNSKIKITDANLIYELDSKGFYQPVYDFTTNIDEEENHHIYIPALKNN